MSSINPKEAAKVFISATFAGIFTDAFQNGLSAPSKPLNVVDSIFNGLQLGTNFIAYPIAQKLLNDKSKVYRDMKSRGNVVFVYGADALLTAAIVAGVNYPLAKAQEKHASGKATVSLKSFGEYFADQILPNVGFPAVNDYLEKRLPVPSDSLSRYLRSTSIAAAASLGGSLANLPLAYFKDGETLGKTLSGWIKSIPAMSCTNDAFEHFSAVVSKIGV